MSRPLLIFAGNRSQAEAYAGKRGLHGSEWRQVDKVDDLQGLYKPRVIRTGLWWKHPDYPAIQRRLTQIAADVIDERI